MKQIILSVYSSNEKAQENWDTSYKFKNKLVIIRRNINHFTGNQYVISKGVGKIFNERVLWKLIEDINSLEELNNAN